MKNLDTLQYLLGATGVGLMLMSFGAYDNSTEGFWLGAILLGIGLAIWFARKEDFEE